MPQQLNQRTVPVGGDEPKRAWFDEYARSDRGILEFATVAAANTWAADAANAGFAVNGRHAWITAENAVYVRSGGQWRLEWRASWERSTDLPTLTNRPGGWPVTVAGCVRVGGWCQLGLQVTPTSGPYGPGNITNIEIGTVLEPAFRPAVPAIGVGVEYGGLVYMNTAGVMALTAVGATAWPSGGASTIHFSYALA